MGETRFIINIKKVKLEQLFDNIKYKLCRRGTTETQYNGVFISLKDIILSPEETRDSGVIKYLSSFHLH